MDDSEHNAAYFTQKKTTDWETQMDHRQQTSNSLYSVM